MPLTGTRSGLGLCMKSVPPPLPPRKVEYKDPLDALAQEPAEDTDDLPHAPVPCVQPGYRVPTNESLESSSKYLASDEVSQWSDESDSCEHPLGWRMLDWQRQDIQRQRKQELENWCAQHEAEHEKYFREASFVRSLMLVNEAQRQDRGLRQARCMGPPMKGLWAHVGTQVELALEEHGGAEVMRGLPAMRLFVPGMQAVTEDLTASRRVRAQRVLAELRATGTLFLRQRAG